MVIGYGLLCVSEVFVSFANFAVSLSMHVSALLLMLLRPAPLASPGRRRIKKRGMSAI